MEGRGRELIYEPRSYDCNNIEQEPRLARLSQNSSWRRPTLPAGYPTSTIGAEGLNCRVRDGNGWFPLALATRKELRSEM